MSAENKSAIMMPKADDLILSSSPHIHSDVNVRKIMLKVILALVPALIASVIFFGWDAVRVIVITALSAVVAEGLWLWLAKRPLTPLRDLSALLTGLLLAMNLPSNASWWICVVGGFLAIWVGKQVFGGLGHNIFNPALVARVALLIALPAAMTTWTPTGGLLEKNMRLPSGENVSITTVAESEAPAVISCATPLGEAAELKRTPNGAATFAPITEKSDYVKYFLGERLGSLGETSCLALLIGGIALMFMKLIKWQIPIFFIATVAVFTAIVHLCAPAMTPPPLFHLLTGGLLLGAFLMATDMVTSPMTTGGCILFGVGCGVITCVIRIWGGYPEGVSFSILLMNALVPLIDRLFQLRPFGYVRKRA